MKVVVVGAGFGGLAVAIRLAVRGHQVVVLERNQVVGGKVATLELDGFRFDLGPAVLTQPDVFDDLFRLAGSSLADEVRLVALDPHARYSWVDGSQLDAHDDDTAWASALERLSPGGAADWQRFATHADRIWDHARGSYLNRPNVAGRSLLGRPRPAVDLAALDGTRTLAALTEECFADPRLRQLANLAAVTVGASPFKAPATLAHLWAAERAGGVWHVEGGVGRLRDALLRAAERVGVTIRTGTEVGMIATAHGAANGVHLSDGGFEPADAVVSDVDAAHLYTELLPHPKRAKELDRAKRSNSGFVLCAGVRGRTDGLAHRTVWFPLHDRPEYERLERGFAALDPTITAVVSSVTDPSMAPVDAENWYVFVQLPPAIGIDRKLMTAAVLNRIAERGFDIRQRIEFTRTLLPADFDARYRAVAGALHGSSSDSPESALQRPSNTGPVDGTYLVGGSTHPGGGLPSVLRSAAIVDTLVAGSADA
jgi:phytoene desaturase